MKCDKCVFRGEIRDMGWTAPCCKLVEDFVEAMAACRKSDDCDFFLTSKDAAILMRKFRGEVNDDEK